MTRAQKIETACNEAEKIANDDSHGYSNVVNDNLGQNGDYDCGAFVSEALHAAGILTPNQWFEPNERYGNPWSYGTVLEPAGFERIPFDYNKVQRGDILIKDGHHTELALGNGKQIGAHDNYDGRRGDYSHLGEISEVPLSGYWDWIYRLKDDGSDTKKTATIKARAYDCVKRKWLPRSKSTGTIRIGTKGHAIGAFAFKINRGSFTYCAMDDSGWLPPVDKYDYNDDIYGMAGNKKPIYCVAIWCSDRNVAYRVKDLITQKWYPWVYSNEETGSAGVYGRKIDEIEFKVVS